MERWLEFCDRWFTWLGTQLERLYRWLIMRKGW